MEACLYLKGPRAQPEIIQPPESQYVTNTEYRCRGCGESFSSPHLTRENPDEDCPFYNSGE